VKEGSEEVKFSEQGEVKLSNPCSHGIGKKNLPFAACMLYTREHRVNLCRHYPRNVEYNYVIHNCFIAVPCCLAPPGNWGSPTRGLWNSADGTAARYFLGGPRFEIW
jgi:hypothetical protein